MEFNEDGSLKLAGISQAEKKSRAEIKVVDIESDASAKLIELTLLDNSLPYNLIESQFSATNKKVEAECDAHLTKRSDSKYEITISGEGTNEWVKLFQKEISDYLDGNIDVN